MHPGRTRFTFLISGLLLASLAGSAGAQWINFSASAEQNLVEGGERAGGQGPYPVRGYLSVPVKAGRHPAVVMLPSCEGRKLFHQSWAQALSEQGYVALVVDDYFMYDRDRTCDITDPRAKTDLLQLRLRHALGAARYLVGHQSVDRSRIAVMGWGDAPVDALLDHPPGADLQQGIFRAAIAVTPERCFGERRSERPLLVLRSGSASAGPDESCEASAGSEVRVYEGTLPGFDNPRFSAGEGSGPGRYNRLAHARAIEDVVAFLGSRLSRDSADHDPAYAAAPAATDSEPGTWALDPASPGPDLPPTGGSAFDAVFSRKTDAGVDYHVPFPFPVLLKKLEHVAGGSEMSRSPLDATLIPLGRSLQREAAAPDYFRSPRIVVAVTGEPDSGRGPLGIRLKDRLFLGYQPRSRVLEVISYNEVAGRFEFQVVSDYGEDGQPVVHYARRALCTSCHQNAGPMFPQASWDETTANARVVSGLGELGKEFFGIPVKENDRAVSSIDASTDGGSLLPVYHRLWAEGCSSTFPVAAARCRAGAVQAMVQYRLSNSAGFDRSAPLYAESYLPLQRDNWQQRWPDGLLIPNPNLPDRSPLMSASPSAVPVALDPLRPREPLARWEATSDRDIDRLIRGLSHELPGRDIDLLDRYLGRDGEAAPTRTLTAACQAVRRGIAGRPRLLELECGKQPDAGDGFSLGAQLQILPDGSVNGEAGWLEVDGAIYARRTLAGQVPDPSGNRITLEVGGYDGTGLRAPDGNRLLGLSVVWDARTADHESRFAATAELAVAGDFVPVSTLMARLADTATANSPLLSDRFDGARLTTWLITELGLEPEHACCELPALPAPKLDAGAPDTAAALGFELRHRGPMLSFRRYCGACHGNDTLFPPGFLHGEAPTVTASVAQCAERIYFRLSMWQRRIEDRVVSPMPPVQGLSLAGTSAEAWRQSETLERLTAYARDLLVAQGREPGEVLQRGYQVSRPCLPVRDDGSYAGLK